MQSSHIDHLSQRSTLSGQSYDFPIITESTLKDIDKSTATINIEPQIMCIILGIQWRCSHAKLPNHTKVVPVGWQGCNHAVKKMSSDWLHATCPSRESLPHMYSANFQGDAMTLFIHGLRVHLKNYVHCLCYLCCGLIQVNLPVWLPYILQDYFIGTGAITCLPQCLWINPEEYW